MRDFHSHGVMGVTQFYGWFMSWNISSTYPHGLETTICDNLTHVFVDVFQDTFGKTLRIGGNWVTRPQCWKSFILHLQVAKPRARLQWASAVLPPGPVWTNVSWKATEIPGFPTTETNWLGQWTLLKHLYTSDSISDGLFLQYQVYLHRPCRAVSGVDAGESCRYTKNRTSEIQASSWRVQKL